VTLHETQQSGVKLFYREAIIRALREELTRDPKLLLFGQDIGTLGGSYREFKGLHGEFGAHRIRDMPIAENIMVGLGVGAAAAGTRTLVNITYMDFLMLALDPLVNYGAKLKFKTGGQLRAPIVVKATAGAKGQGVVHSQCIESWLMGVPGLKVLAPSTPEDAYGLLKSALREEGPVLYIDHKRLFPTAGYVPLEETLAPIGYARLVRTGDHVTLCSHSYMMLPTLKAADTLAEKGIFCDVIDLRCLAPLDLQTICTSVAKTKNLVTIEEGQLTCGVGTEIAFRVREQVEVRKVARLGANPIPVSSSFVLEAAALPDAEKIYKTVQKMLLS